MVSYGSGSSHRGWYKRAGSQYRIRRYCGRHAGLHGRVAEQVHIQAGKEANAISRQKLKVQSGPKRLGYKESKHQPGYLVPDKLDHAVLRYTMYCRKKEVPWKTIANRLEEILAKREGRKPIALFWEEKRLYPIHKLKRLREKFLGIGTLDIYDPKVSDAYRASEFYSKKVARDSA